MADLQRFFLEVQNEGRQSDSLTIRLEHDAGSYSAQAEHGGALVSQCEGHTAVEALTSCLQQVGVVDKTQRVLALHQEGDRLISETEFEKTCRDVGIAIAD